MGERPESFRARGHFSPSGTDPAVRDPDPDPAGNLFFFCRTEGEDDFADTGDFELADVIGPHETAYDMASDNKDKSNALCATGMIHNSRKHTLVVTFVLEDGTETTKTFRKQQ